MKTIPAILAVSRVSGHQSCDGHGRTGPAVAMIPMVGTGPVLGMGPLGPVVGTGPAVGTISVVGMGSVVGIGRCSLSRNSSDLLSVPQHQLLNHPWKQASQTPDNLPFESRTTRNAPRPEEVAGDGRGDRDLRRMSERPVK